MRVGRWDALRLLPGAYGALGSDQAPRHPGRTRPVS